MYVCKCDVETWNLLVKYTDNVPFIEAGDILYPHINFWFEWGNPNQVNVYFDSHYLSCEMMLYHHNKDVWKLKWYACISSAKRYEGRDL